MPVEHDLALGCLPHLVPDQLDDVFEVPADRKGLKPKIIFTYFLPVGRKVGFKWVDLMKAKNNSQAARS